VLHINLDLAPLLDLKNLKPVAQKALRNAADSLIIMTKNHIVEEAQQKLHSRLGMYIEGLSSFKADKDTWIISLDASVAWVDDGLEAHSQLDDLLASPKAKRSKSGSKYISVPFQINKKQADMTPAQKALFAAVKKELASVGVKMNQVETNAKGMPRIGLVRSLDINNAPVKQWDDQPGAGHGPVGEAFQGKTGTPFLKGIRVYQKEAGGKIQRNIMTFRTASSTQQGKGMWDHPGVKGVHLFEEAHNWALSQWSEKIVPQLLSEITSSV